jgi:hypothetical protein
MENKTIKERQLESERVIGKYPGTIPVVLIDDEKDILLIKKKYIVADKSQLGDFIISIKDFNNIKEKIVIYTTDLKKPNITTKMIDLYRNHKYEDGFLYLHVTDDSWYHVFSTYLSYFGY